MNFLVAILYAPDGQRPLSVARIRNRSLLAVAAERAVAEAEAAAADLMTEDPILGNLQMEEAEKLRRIFRIAVPASNSGSRTVM